MIQAIQSAFSTSQINPAQKKRQTTQAISLKTFDTLQFGNTQAHPLAKYIDHTKLTYKEGEKPIETIKKLCAEAKANQFYAVCVRPDKIELAKSELEGTGVQVATVIGFPQTKVELADEQAHATIGNYSIEEKLAETQQALKAGADELDLVLNVQQFRDEGSPGYHQDTVLELASVKAMAGDVPVKVIIEADLLTDEEIVQATKACIAAGVDFVKTSTGMVSGGHGATVEDVTLIADTLKEFDPTGNIQIKASGGIRTPDDANAMVDSGATRLGTSRGVGLVTGSESDPNSY